MISLAVIPESAGGCGVSVFEEEEDGIATEVDTGEDGMVVEELEEAEVEAEKKVEEEGGVLETLDSSSVVAAENLVFLVRLLLHLIF
jgi:hypothetical protein